MRILIATDIYYPLVCGCTYFVERLATQLQQRGHQVLVLAPSESFSDANTIKNDITVSGIKSYPAFLNKNVRMSMLFSSYKKIEKIVDDFKPDVIHCHLHFGIVRATLKVAQNKGIPTVGTNHFMPENMVHYLPFYKYFKTMINKLAWHDFGRVFSKVDKITTPTQTAAELIIPYVKKPVTPISCGIDLERFKPGQNGESLREKYNIPKKPILLSVCRLDKEKNLDLVIKSCARAMRNTSFQLVIAGVGSQEKILKRLVDELQIAPFVTFTGLISNGDLPKLYCLAECFIMAGTAELQSIATMEAMASGLPVLAANAVALPELVKDNINGFLLSLKEEEVAKKIELIFSQEELRKNMSQKSLELIDRHALPKTLEQYEQLYAF